MNNQQIKEKILSSIAQAKEKGITLISEDWGSEKYKYACAIGCVLAAQNQPFANGDISAMCGALQVDDKWITSFIDGFDDNGRAELAHLPEVWKMGEEVRKQTNPISVGDFFLSLENEQ